MTTFYNTIKAGEPQLGHFKAQAATQDEVILDLFKRNAHRTYTPFEAMKAVDEMGHKWPITSVRRAINTLTEGKKLIKLDGEEGRPLMKRQGEYDKENFAWRYFEVKAPIQLKLI